MNYDLLWNMEEYQSLLDYKWNSFKYINMFLNEDITNRERRFNPNAKAYPKTPEEFKKAIETITKLYEAIQKNYILNGSKEYQQQLFRGIRKNSNHSYFTSTSENLDVALSFIDGINNGNTNNDVLVEIEPSQIAWIDLEAFIPSSKGGGSSIDGGLGEKEILFLPCEYQTLQETKFPDYLRASGLTDSLSRKTQRRLSKLQDLTCRKAKLVAPSYKSSSFMSLEALASRFEQYRQNLIKLTEATKKGLPTTLIEKDIMEFKKFCSDYLKYQFNRIDMELQKQNTQRLSREQIQIDRNSTIEEVHIGNTGRMFAIKSPNGVEKYYFKPAESKDRTTKPYRAYIQEAAYNVQRIVNPVRAIKCNTCNINGTFGAIQEKVEVDKEETKQFYRYFSGYGGELSQKLLSQILDEYLVDYCLCNYDAHAKNFVIDVNGNLRGIDKEQSFRYIDRDANDDMLFSQNYNEEYGESETIYARIFKKIANGEISYKVLEGLDYRAARLAQVPDEQYRQMFQNYASSKTKTPEESKMLLDRIVERKKAMTQKIDLLKQDMFQKSDGKVKGTDEYIFTDNIRPPIKRTHIKQEVVDIVTGKAFQRQEQTPYANKNNLSDFFKTKEEFSSNHILGMAEGNVNSPSVKPYSNQEKIEREKLEEERRELRRKQFAERKKAMGIDQDEVIDFDDLIKQQEIIEKMNVEKQENVENFGMHM